MAHVTRILFSLRAGLIGGTGKVAVVRTLNEGLNRCQKLLGTVRESKKARRSWFISFQVAGMPLCPTHGAWRTEVICKILVEGDISARRLGVRRHRRVVRERRRQCDRFCRAG